MKQQMRQQGARQQMRMAPPIAKTKKYQVQLKDYMREGLKLAFTTFWYAFLVPVVIVGLAIIWPKATTWLVVTAIVLTVLWVGFWVLQFYALKILPQGKEYFERQWLEFFDKGMAIRRHANEKPEEMRGLTFDMISRAKLTSKALMFFMGASKVSFFYIPLEAFASQHDFKTVENLLKRRGLLK